MLILLPTQQMLKTVNFVIKILLVMLYLDLTSLLAHALLFTASADLGYRIFVVANEKFLNVFVRTFRESSALGHHIWLQTGELSCSSEPNSTLFTSTLQIISV